MKNKQESETAKENIKNEVLSSTIPTIKLCSMLSLLYNGHNEFYNGNDAYIIICKNKREKICSKIYIKNNDIGFYDLKFLIKEFEKEYKKEFVLKELLEAKILHICTHTNSNSIRIYVNL